MVEAEKHTFLIMCKINNYFEFELMCNYHRVNTTCGPKEDKLLLSGLHVICDLFCKNCHTIVGWKYVNV